MHKDHISSGERGGYEDKSKGCVTKTGCSAEETDKNMSVSYESFLSTEGFLFHSSWQPGCHTSLWIKDSMAKYILPDFQKVEKLSIRASVILNCRLLICGFLLHNKTLENMPTQNFESLLKRHNHFIWWTDIYMMITYKHWSTHR